MLHPTKTTWLTVLTILTTAGWLTLPTSIPSAQPELNCSNLTFQYPVLEAPPVWINNTQVIFKSGLGLENVAIGHDQEKNEVDFYDVTTGYMSAWHDVASLSAGLAIDTSAIPELAKDPSANLQIYRSPDHKHVIFPRNNSYWYKDLNTGALVDLGVEYHSDDLMAFKLPLLPVAFWSSDSQKVIFDHYLWSLEKQTEVIEINDTSGHIQVQKLSELAPWNNRLNNMIGGFTINGISPDWHYLIVAQITTDDSTSVYDMRSGTVTNLPFTINTPYVYWINAHKFVAPDTDGYIIYDLEQRTITPFLSNSPFVNSLVLSPDGRYAVGFPDAPMNAPHLVQICKIPIPIDDTPVPATSTPSGSNQSATSNGGSVPGSNQIGGG